MTIDVPYNLFQRVRIPELSAWGIIVSIAITMTGVQYEVRYFMGGDAKNTYFLEAEIQAKP